MKSERNHTGRDKPLSRVRPVSNQRRKALKLYSALAAPFLAEALRDRSFARQCRKEGGPEIHHLRGRLGTLLIDRRYWRAVTSQAHRWIHDNPGKARLTGALCAPGEWNVAPRDAETDRLREALRTGRLP